MLYHTPEIYIYKCMVQGIAPQLAEIYYIVGAQQLEGYGQDCFLAKVLAQSALKHFGP